MTLTIRRKNNGFSLLELSIVLVIIGLIAGGIVAGASMIRAAELRAVITEKQQFDTAVYTFRDKYLGIPGDLKNAEAFWGTMATGTCPNATAGTGTQTCNGDGDGVIERALAVSQTGETFTFWQHLANAELISGTFTGIAGPTTNAWHSIIGENVPESKLSGTGWANHPHGVQAGDTVLFAGDYGNNLVIGNSTTQSIPEIAAFTPEEAWNIDKKIDDGKPGTGKMWIRYWDTCTDAASNGSVTASHIADAEYLLSDKSIQCAIYFPNSY